MSDPETIDLTAEHCQPCEGGVPPLEQERVDALLKQVPEWEQRAQTITRKWKFEDFYQTMAFVNAVAWVANRENHHPDMEVGYNTCRVSFTTHAIGGLSQNDFICAAKIDALLA